MRTSLMVLASLLLLVLATTAHGIRLDRHLHEALGNKEQLAGQLPKPNGAADSTGSKPCTADGNCSGKAKKPPSPHAHAEPEDDASAAKHQIPPKRNDDGDAQGTGQDGGQEEAALPRQPQQKTWSRRALPRRAQQPKDTRTYPDLIDIAGMDYSPAARKPPIHN